MNGSTMSSRPRSLFASAPIVGFGLAVIALLLLAAAPFGWRAGLWTYSVSLQTLLPYAAYAAVAGGIISALALVFGRGALGGRGLVLAAIGLIVGAGVAAVPLYWNNARTAVANNDITTDTSNPPTFSAVLDARKAEDSIPVTYDPKMAAQQRQAYPDIAAVILPLHPSDAFTKALAAAKSMSGWTIVASDPATGHIEASQSTRWMHFTDDVVIRVAKDEDGSRVDIRSHSRHGRNDFGVNAARVRAYLAALKAG
ncbi:MAG: DUF1499 domain-containing protein [Alphaproteobacteria bacterium]|nr:DUF1499 domain-containing protein [Alphaproteobacteria bacterium]